MLLSYDAGWWSAFTNAGTPVNSGTARCDDTQHFGQVQYTGWGQREGGQRKGQGNGDGGAGGKQSDIVRLP